MTLKHKYTSKFVAREAVNLDFTWGLSNINTLVVLEAGQFKLFKLEFLNINTHIVVEDAANLFV